MANVPLRAAITGAQEDVGNAIRNQTYRFQSPEAQMCPVWNGTDLAGRPVCIDSFYTKYAGCNSPLDRIKVENFLRPAYSNYITLSASGIAGVDAHYAPNMHTEETEATSANRLMKQAQTGKFGLVSAEAISRNGSGKASLEATNAYQDAVGATNQRVNQALGIGYRLQKLNPETNVVMNRNDIYMTPYKPHSDNYIDVRMYNKRETNGMYQVA